MERKKFALERGMELSVRLLINDNIEMGMSQLEIVRKLGEIVRKLEKMLSEEELEKESQEKVRAYFNRI